MKIKSVTKFALAGAMFSAAPLANAIEFYVNPNVDYDASPAAQACATCTGYKDQATVNYQSQTVITDDFLGGGDGVGFGDSVSTSGGLAVGGFDFNHVEGFLPIHGLSSSHNGYGWPNWAISFSTTDLEGIVTGMVAGVPIVTYTSGTIDLLFSNELDGGGEFTNFVNFMDLKVTFGQVGPADLDIVGNIDFSDVDVAPGDANDWLLDLFNMKDAPVCASSDSFHDIWTDCTDPVLEISFHLDQNTDDIVGPDFNGVNGDGFDTYLLSANHNGSVDFNVVPAPGTLALMGAALLGFGAAARRQKKQA